MARYVTSVPTTLAPDAAFAFTADVTRFPSWDPGVASSVQVLGDGPGKRAEYDLTIAGSRPSVMRYVVEEFDAPRRMKMTAQTRWLRSVDEIRIQAHGAGSLVTYDAVLTMRGPLALFDPLLALAFKRIGDRAAAGLRRVLGAP